MWIERVESPIGEIVLVGEEDALVSLDFGDCDERLRTWLERRYGSVDRARREGTPAASVVSAYFDGDLDALDSLAVQPRGTDFQQQVWRELRKVRAGRTVSYGELAARIGAPQASRPVGMANARNPIALVVPCHRVIGSNGKLTGYAGGLDRKLWLLRHEGAMI